MGASRAHAIVVCVVVLAGGCSADGSTALDTDTSSAGPSPTTTTVAGDASDAATAETTMRPTTTTGTAIDTSNEGVSPKTITKPPACDDEGACAAGFLLDGVFVGLDCTPIKESAVTPVVIAAGRVSGEDVTVNVIDGVDPAVMMAISLPGGGCTDDDPDERRSAWSLAVPDFTDHELLREAVCRVGDLTDQQLLANGCDGAGEVDGQRYSVDDLRDGVAVSVDDAAGAVDSATVFLPDDLPSYLSLHPQLDQERVAVLHPGEGGFDAAVVYRTGPFCGVLPNVAVSGDETVLTVEIATLGDGGECDAMEYDEAIGLELAAEFEGATIEASQAG